MEETHKQFKMGSLFSGSGGFELAATLCDIEPRWSSEIEPFPIRVTTKRFPHMKHYGDISTIKGSELEPVDLITGGSPCQSLSVAGKRDGMSKKCPKCGYKTIATTESDICPECGSELQYTRSGLFMEQIRVVKEMRQADELARLRSGRTDEHIRPRFMLWENVTGAFSSNKGEDFRAVLEETARVKEETATIPRPPKGKWHNAGCIMGNGWSIAWRTLDAQYWGVPQRRRRIALVADFGGQCAGEILFKREGLSRNFTESRYSWQAIARSSTDSIGETGECGVGIPLDMTHANDVIREYKDGICPTLQHRMGTGGNQVPITMQVRCGSPNGGGKGALLQINKSATLDTLNMQTLFQPIPIQDQAISNGSGHGLGVGESGDKMYSLMAEIIHGICCIEGNESRPSHLGDGYKESETMYTLNVAEYIVRRLTPLECSRLQGFPDWWLDGLETEDPTEQDIAFWREVFETHRKVVTGAKKPKTDKQIIKWLKNPYSDGAAYKLWGNGIALPCFLYVMEGIKEILERTSTKTHETQPQGM